MRRGRQKHIEVDYECEHESDPDCRGHRRSGVSRHGADRFCGDPPACARARCVLRANHLGRSAWFRRFPVGGSCVQSAVQSGLRPRGLSAVHRRKLIAGDIPWSTMSKPPRPGLSRPRAISGSHQNHAAGLTPQKPAKEPSLPGRLAGQLPPPLHCGNGTCTQSRMRGSGAMGAPGAGRPGRRGAAEPYAP